MPTDKKLQPFALPTIRTLYSLDKLELTPDYQRESVWSRSQRQLLIDSLIHNFDIPKLYFRKLSGQQGGREYEVVDGQQRLRSVIDFFENKFPISEDADPLNGNQIAKRYYRDLPTDAIIALDTAQLDVVVLIGYSDEEVREMFARLQNGTSLNAAEKRHAWAQAMTAIVKDLSTNKAFEAICDFSPARYAYEDMAAKILHEILADRIVDIRQPSIKATYEANPRLDVNDKAVKKAVKVLNFLRSALSAQTVRLKKYSLLSLAILVGDLIEEYNLGRFPQEFGEWYEEFERRRLENKLLDEVDPRRNADMVEFTENARNDSLAALIYRDKVLRQNLFTALTDLEPLDKTRGFSSEQRLFVYLRDGKKCQECGKNLSLEEAHIDHVKPYSSGGATTVTNARLTCIPCNLAKGAGLSPTLS
ncbi:MAG: DUF262 domain-containing protein [Vulcanimicrobiaceae bacterium]|jgi:hypothetical protein